MATFLTLCRSVHRILRIGEDAPGTAPETVEDQEGVLAEIVAWVQDAYRDIQSDQDAWAFREQSTVVSIGTARTVGADLLPDDYEVLRPYTADFCRRHILVSPTGEAPENSQPVWFIEWEHWRGGRYERGQAVDATGQPSYFTVMPDGSLRFDRTPVVPTDITIAYQRTLHELAVDDDVPILPARHHDAIVWRAAMAYADSREKTSESYQKWERRRKQAMNRLYRDQLPEMSF